MTWDQNTLTSQFVEILIQHPGVDLLIKSSFIILLAIIFNFSLKKYSASVRHIIWSIAILSLSLLPIFLRIGPTIELEILLEAPAFTPTNNLISSSSLNIAETAQWLSTIYFSAVIIFILYILLGIFRVYQLSRSASITHNTEIQQEFNNILAEEDITLKIKLLESKSIISPLSWGLVNPEIILPLQASNWSSDKIRNVLIHELSHIQKLDWPNHLLSRLVCAMFWYNPLVWFAARKLGEEAEQACDDAVLLYGKSHGQYASNLLEIAEAANGKKHRNILAEAIANSFLGSRILAILDANKSRNKTEEIWLIRGMLISFSLVALIASLRFIPIYNTETIKLPFVRLIPVDYSSAKNDIVKPGYIISKRPTMVETTSYPVDPLNERQARINSSNSLALDISGPKKVKSPKISFSLTAPDSTLFANYESFIRPINESFPVYPEQAKRNGIEGYSIIEYEITESGKVINPSIIESSPGRIFNRSSINAIENYLYEPPMLNGRAVGIQGLRMKFIYQLQPESG